MTVAQTSLLTWDTTVEPSITKRQKDVLTAMKLIGKPCIPEDVAIFLGKFEHQVSGRFSEMRESGVIRYHLKDGEPEKRKNSRGNKCFVHELAPEEAE